MMNKQIYSRIIKIFLTIACVVLSISIVMNTISRFLEKKNKEEATPEFWIPKEESTVMNLLVAGTANAKEAQTTLSVDILETVGNYDMSVYTQQKLVGTDVSAVYALSLCETGFNHVSLAVPNVFQYGKEGVEASANYWSETGVICNGQNLSTDAQNLLRPVEINGISVIFLSYTDYLDYDLPENMSYLVNRYDEDKTPYVINDAAQLADVVVVSVFWEGEQGALPNDRQKAIANAMADAGASVIIGNTKDAVQPVGWLGDTLVFYSLGNLTSDASIDEVDIGALGAVTITKVVAGDKKRIELTNPKVDLIMTVDDEVKHLSDIGEETLEFVKDYYDGYVETIHRMDDSIRIGGLE